MRNYKLMKILDKKNMKQGELARAVKISETQMSRISRGISKPRQDEIDRICKYLGCSPNTIGMQKEN